MIFRATRMKSGLFLLLIAMLYLAEIVAIRVLSDHGGLQPAVAIAPVVDLIILPLLLFGLFYGWEPVRQLDGRVIVLCSAGAAFVRFALPAAVSAGPTLEIVFAIVEAVVVVRLAMRAKQVTSTFQRARATGLDLFECYAEAFATALPRPLAWATALELTLLASLLGIGRASATTGASVSFGYVHRTAMGATCYVLAGLSCVEATVTHIVLSRWAEPRWHWLIWTLTVLSLYGALWLIATYRTMVARPHQLIGESLLLRVGLLWWCTVPLAQVDSAWVDRKAGGKMTGYGWIPDPTVFSLTVLGAPCNVLITLSEPVEVHSVFGKSRRVRRLAVLCDEPQALVNRITPNHSAQ